MDNIVFTHEENAFYPVPVLLPAAISYDNAGSFSTIVGNDNCYDRAQAITLIHDILLREDASQNRRSQGIRTLDKANLLMSKRKEGKKLITIVTAHAGLLPEFSSICSSRPASAGARQAYSNDPAVWSGKLVTTDFLLTHKNLTVAASLALQSGGDVIIIGKSPFLRTDGFASESDEETFNLLLNLRRSTSPKEWLHAIDTIDLCAFRENTLKCLGRFFPN